MSLQTVFEAVSDFFKREKMDYGIIGAFALYSYGYVRATRDIDFVTRIDYKDRTIGFLESRGFETLFSSNAFSNHLHPIGSVRVDIMYVAGKTADEILNSTEDRLIFKGFEQPVVRAEHLIAMKLFAIRNNPDRKQKDLADVREIFLRTSLDKKVVRELFRKFGQESFYHEITGATNDQLQS
jgi:hypothetical protein